MSSRFAKAAPSGCRDFHGMLATGARVSFRERLIARKRRRLLAIDSRIATRAVLARANFVIVFFHRCSTFCTGEICKFPFAGCLFIPFFLRRSFLVFVFFISHVANLARVLLGKFPNLVTLRDIFLAPRRLLEDKGSTTQSTRGTKHSKLLEDSINRSNAPFSQPIFNGSH